MIPMLNRILGSRKNSNLHCACDDLESHDSEGHDDSLPGKWQPTNLIFCLFSTIFTVL